MVLISGMGTGSPFLVAERSDDAPSGVRRSKGTATQRVTLRRQVASQNPPRWRHGDRMAWSLGTCGGLRAASRSSGDRQAASAAPVLCRRGRRPEWWWLTRRRATEGPGLRSAARDPSSASAYSKTFTLRSPTLRLVQRPCHGLADGPNRLARTEFRPSIGAEPH